MTFFISFHVDDLILATADEALRANIVARLKKILKIVDLGDLSFCRCLILVNLSDLSDLS